MCLKWYALLNLFDLTADTIQWEHCWSYTIITSNVLGLCKNQLGWTNFTTLKISHLFLLERNKLHYQAKRLWLKSYYHLTCYHYGKPIITKPTILNLDIIIMISTVLSNTFYSKTNKLIPRTSHNSIKTLILTDVCVVVFPPNWCHFLEDDVFEELAFVKGILQKTGWKVILRMLGRTINWFPTKTIFPRKHGLKHTD